MSAPWLPLSTLVVAAHVLANVVWIGALLSEVLLLGRARWLSDPSQAGFLARRVHARLAVPAFLASLAAGLGRLLPAWPLYSRMRWMHAKLGFAAVIIIVHHIVGARAERVADGNDRAGRSAWVLGWIVLACAGGAVLFAVAKTTP